MPLILGFDPSGLPGAVVSALDDIIAPLQTWAGAIDGINADERLNALTTGVSSLSTVPTGAMMAWAATVAPSGWVLCDGGSYNRVTYISLFTVLGVTYGAGDGSSTFNVPDLRGRFPLGLAAAGTGSVLGGSGGNLDHTHSVPAIAAHTHTVSGSTANESAHTHTYSGNTGQDNSDSGTPFGADQFNGTDTATHPYSGTTSAGSAHSHGAGSLAADSGGGSGAGTSGSANPAFLSVAYIIKT